jgi:regulatory protein
MAFAPPSLKGRALRLLSAREYSRAELERKLQRFEEESGALERILDELQSKGFIDEQRVIESVLHRRAAKLGSARIKQELQGKGLDPLAVTEALASLQTSELDRAQTLWCKKFSVAATDAKTQAKQMRFLLSRGFAAETIRRVVKASPDQFEGN